MTSREPTEADTGRPTRPFRLGEWDVWPDRNRIRAVHPRSDGRDERTLEPRIMKALVCLASRAGRTVSHQELLEEVWTATNVTTSSISLAISDLRRALDDDARRPRYIETVTKVGYRLLIEPAPAVGEGSDDPGEDPDTGRASGEPGPGGSDRGSSGGRPIRRAIVLGGALLVAAVWWVVLRFPEGPTSPSVQRPASRSAATSQQVPVPVTSLAGRELEPTASSEGDLAFLRWAGEGEPMRVHLRPREGPTGPLPGGSGFETSPVWAPDRRALAFLRCPGGGCSLLLDELDGTGPVELARLSSYGGRRLAWFPDGRSLLVVDRTEAGTLAIHRLEIGDRASPQEEGLHPFVAPAPDLEDAFPAVSENGDLVAFVRGTSLSQTDSRTEAIVGRIWIRGRDGSLRQIPTAEIDVRGLAWASDGRHLIVARFRRDRGGEIALLDTASGRIEPLASTSGLFRNPTLDRPDRDRILFESWTVDRNVWRLTFDGGPPEALVDSSRSDEWPRIHPAGESVAFLSLRTGRYQLWVRDLASGRDRQLTHLPPGDVPSPARWSPDGRRLAFFVEHGDGATLRIVEAASGEARDVVTLATPGTVSAWSPSGEEILYSAVTADRWNVWSIGTTQTRDSEPRLALPGALEAHWCRKGTEHVLLYSQPASPGIFGAGSDSGPVIETRTSLGPGTWGVVERGAYWVQRERGRYVIRLWDSETGEIVELGSATIRESQGSSMALSNDATWAAFVHLEDARSDIVSIPLVGALPGSSVGNAGRSRPER